MVCVSNCIRCLQYRFFAMIPRRKPCSRKYHCFPACMYVIVHYTSLSASFLPYDALTYISSNIGGNPAAIVINDRPGIGPKNPVKEKGIEPSEMGNCCMR